ncbi:hypothetical protein GW17_00027132 [Ensete ventricosum]|nr:hypothetical protein GW17_00027132 [Ensete ventricosum]
MWPGLINRRRSENRSRSRRKPASKWPLAVAAEREDEKRRSPLHLLLSPLLRRIFSESIMNRVLRSVLVGSPVSPFSPMHVSFFHSTPVLERRRKNCWHPRFNYYVKRKRKMESKRTQVCNLSDYAEYLFQLA